MSKKEIQLAALVILGGLFAWVWFTSAGRRTAGRAGSAIVTGVERVAQLARGIRNNNPGNIRISSITWQGKIDPSKNTDGAFEQFITMSDGVRALAKNLLTYFDRHKLDTVRKVITRWAPPSENITGAYVQNVASKIGVKPDDRINLRDPNMLSLVTEGIIAHENGAAQAAMVSDADIASGVTRALS